MATKTQVQKFRDTARALEADEDEAEFNKTLGKIARAKPPDPDKVAELRSEIAKAKRDLPPHPKRSRNLR
jgi:hypothetical protein